MPYTKTIWVNGIAPNINATNLNNIEQGIFDAHRLSPTGVAATDTANLQAALAANRPIELGPGTFKLNAKLDITRVGQEIIGSGWEQDGTILEQTVNNTPIFDYTTDNVHSTRIEHMQLIAEHHGAQLRMRAPLGVEGLDHADRDRGRVANRCFGPHRNQRLSAIADND